MKAISRGLARKYNVTRKALWIPHHTQRPVVPVPEVKNYIVTDITCLISPSPTQTHLQPYKLFVSLFLLLNYLPLHNTWSTFISHCSLTQQMSSRSSLLSLDKTLILHSFPPTHCPLPPLCVPLHLLTNNQLCTLPLPQHTQLLCPIYMLLVIRCGVKSWSPLLFAALLCTVSHQTVNINNECA